MRFLWSGNKAPLQKDCCFTIGDIIFIVALVRIRVLVFYWPGWFFRCGSGHVCCVNVSESECLKGKSRE